MIRSVEEAELPKGCQPLPKKAKKRKRITILDGSSIRFEALPPDEGMDFSLHRKIESF